MLRGLSGLPQGLDHSPHPAEFGHWNSSLRCGVCRCGPNRLGWRALQTGAERDEGARSKQNRYRFVFPRHTVANECGPCGERQEHLNASVSFTGAAQRRRFFQGLDILTIKWATGTLARRVPLPPEHAIDVLEERKGPNLETVRRRRVKSLVDGSARNHRRRPRRQRHV